MRKTEIKDKKFKIVPEASFIAGEEYRKLMCDEMDGVSEIHKRILSRVFNLIGARDFLMKPGAEKIHAKAVCDPRDTFDEKIGIDVCSAKLDWKQHMSLAKECDKAFRILSCCNHWLYAKCQYHYNKAQAIEKDLNEYYGKGKSK